MLEADCSVVAESCTLLTELRLTTETLLSVDDVRPIAELLTNCRLATELLVVLLELTTTLLSRPTSDTEFCVTATKLTIGSTCSISTTIPETLGEVLTISEREALPCSCKEEVAFCVEAETTVFNLLTSCKFGTLLAVVVATAVLTLEVTPILEVEAAVELTSCMTALPLKGIDETAGDVLVETVVLLLELTATEAVELAVVAEILQVEVFGVPVTDIEDTLAAVLEDTETAILLATDTEDVEFCVEAETTVFNLLTSCKFGTLLAVVVESVALLLEASVMFETEAAVEDVICVAELPLSVIVEDADAVLETTEAALLFTTAIEDIAFCVVAAIETSEEVSCSPKNQDVAIG